MVKKIYLLANFETNSTMALREGAFEGTTCLQKIDIKVSLSSTMAS